jgi:ubiquinone biosynthesis monooxygenase Coq7
MAQERRVTRPVPPRPGSGALAARIAEVLRVDHAGELAAVQIYRGQRAVFAAAPGKAEAAARFEAMGQEEQRHLEAFEALLAERQVRPSLLSPLWRGAGFMLGAATALMGEAAAHACTEAVESVIEQHYAGQAAELADREPDLAARLEEYRADELGHHDRAIESGAHDAPAYGFLTTIIRLGCLAAIKAAEKV